MSQASAFIQASQNLQERERRREQVARRFRRLAIALSIVLPLLILSLLADHGGRQTARDTVAIVQQCTCWDSTCLGSTWRRRKTSLGQTFLRQISLGRISLGPSSLGLTSLGLTSLGLTSLGLTSLGLTSLEPTSLEPTYLGPTLTRGSPPQCLPLCRHPHWGKPL